MVFSRDVYEDKQIYRSQGIQRQSYINGACLTLWVNLFRVCSVDMLFDPGQAYDYVLTFGLELSFIWRAAWNIPKVLYLCTRYLPLLPFGVMIYCAVMLLSPLDYRRLTRCLDDMETLLSGEYYTCQEVIIWVLSVSTCAAEMIFIIRTWAVWDRGRKMGIFLSTFYVAVWASLFITIRTVLRNWDGIISSPITSVPLLGCPGATSGSRLNSNYLIIGLFYIVTLPLMSVKAYHNFTTRSSTSFVQAVIYDGTFYYASLFSVSVAVIIIDAIGYSGYANALSRYGPDCLSQFPLETFNVSARLQQILSSVLACRMLLHLRERGGHTARGGGSRSYTSGFTMHMDTLVFRSMGVGPERENAEAGYINASCIALWVYDYVCTFALEASLIWNAPWNVPKVLYLFTRYLPLVAFISMFCHVGLHVENPTVCQEVVLWSLNVGMVTAELIFVIRTWAVWGRTFKMTIFLAVFSISTWAAHLTVIGLSLPKTGFAGLFGPPLHFGCGSIAANEIIFPTFIIVPLFYLVISSGRKLDRTLSGVVLFDGGVWGLLYYTCLLILSLCVLPFLFAGYYFPEIGSMILRFQQTLCPMLASRLLLQLRESGRRNIYGTDTRQYPSGFTMHMDTLVFMQPSDERHGCVLVDLECGGDLARRPSDTVLLGGRCVRNWDGARSWSRYRGRQRWRGWKVRGRRQRRQVEWKREVKRITETIERKMELEKKKKREAVAAKEAMEEGAEEEALERKLGRIAEAI
ncbi:hypothetical protein Hypma_016382 [Hypsizygus marmoreus]|uniref:DUF6533 domain-containing protein n=1 Tax=Hypsizygus marmoreus TaxID=39966 RepID=A0A369IYL5_HYPMA|nr:hypothetical protein Hypma_016382 [Hypsizygus marmoreus]